MKYIINWLSNPEPVSLMTFMSPAIMLVVVFVVGSKAAAHTRLKLGVGARGMHQAGSSWVKLHRPCNEGDGYTD